MNINEHPKVKLNFAVKKRVFPVSDKKIQEFPQTTPSTKTSSAMFPWEHLPHPFLGARRFHDAAALGHRCAGGPVPSGAVEVQDAAEAATGGFGENGRMAGESYPGNHRCPKFSH